VLSGHPYAVQQASLAASAAANGTSHAAAAPEARSLHHSATAPVHSHLLDTAAEAAAAAEGLNGVTSSGRPRTSLSGHTTAPLSITGAVSRASIELLPAGGPGLVPHGTPPHTAAPVSPSAAIAAAAAAGQPGSWFLASGSSFKKGMWLEKTHSMTGAAPAGPAAAGGLRLPSGSTAAAAGNSPAQQPAMSPLVPSSPLSLGAAVAAPDFGESPHRSSFSLQLRRESQLLPTVAEDELHGAWQAGVPAGGADGTADGAAAAAAAVAAATGEAAAARALRRSQTTRRLSTDVLAAAGALSKALSAFTSASQALPTVPSAVGSPSEGTAAAAAGVGGAGVAVPAAAGGGNILLTQDFVAAARGLSKALAALLPSATALADADPGQGAAAAAAASEAVQGLKSLQGRMAAAKAAAGAAGQRRSSEDPCGNIQRPGAAAGTAGLMGPPAPVNMAAAAAAAAPAAAETAFAQQQGMAFSPPDGFSAPVHSAALPVPITGPRRSLDSSSGSGIPGPRHSFDGSSGSWVQQMSWQQPGSRPRTHSASGNPGELAGPGSFDAAGMSMPGRSLDDSSSGMLGRAGMFSAAAKQQQQQQQSLQEQDAAAGGSGPAAAAGGGDSWRSEPMVVRQPSRRRSMEGRL
jgi:hypothetical protein